MQTSALEGRSTVSFRLGTFFFISCESFKLGQTSWEFPLRTLLILFYESILFSVSLLFEHIYSDRCAKLVILTPAVCCVNRTIADRNKLDPTLTKQVLFFKLFFVLFFGGRFLAQVKIATTLDSLFVNIVWVHLHSIASTKNRKLIVFWLFLYMITAFQACLSKIKQKKKCSGDSLCNVSLLLG